MNLAMIFSYIGHVLRLEALFLLPPLGISLFHGEHAAVMGLAVTAVLLLIVGQLMVSLQSPETANAPSITERASPL